MPLGLVSRVLEQAGALVERAGDGALEAVLPPALAAALGLPEHAVLSADGRAGTVPCGHGTAVLGAAIERAARAGAAAVVRACVTPPRPGPPQVYTGLNVALRPGAPEPAEGWTLTAHLRLDAAADDRRLAPLAASVALEEGCPIPTPALSGVALEPVADRPDAALLAAAEGPLSRAALAAALAALSPFREVVARRRRRDALRIDRYFVELDADLRRRGERAGGGAAGAGSPGGAETGPERAERAASSAARAERATGGARTKRVALLAERARRLAALRDDATVRARVDVVGLLLVRAPVAAAPLELLRRKRRRTLCVRWHPLLRAWLPLACEGCGEPTRALGACDGEAVHVLCARCVEARRCPRCERGGGALAPAGRLDVPAHEEVVRIDGPACGGDLEAEAGAPASPPGAAPAAGTPAAAAGTPPADVTPTAATPAAATPAAATPATGTPAATASRAQGRAASPATPATGTPAATASRAQGRAASPAPPAARVPPATHTTPGTPATSRTPAAAPARDLTAGRPPDVVCAGAGRAVTPTPAAAPVTPGPPAAHVPPATHTTPRPPAATPRTPAAPPARAGTPSATAGTPGGVARAAARDGAATPAAAPPAAAPTAAAPPAAAPPAAAPRAAEPLTPGTPGAPAARPRSGRGETARGAAAEPRRERADGVAPRGPAGVAHGTVTPSGPSDGPEAPVARDEGAGEALAALLRATGRPLSSADLQEATGLSAAALRAELAPLVAAGRVARTGQTRATRYTWVGP